jgi:hypothetical protein
MAGALALKKAGIVRAKHGMLKNGTAVAAAAHLWRE